MPGEANDTVFGGHTDVGRYDTGFPFQLVEDGLLQIAIIGHLTLHVMPTARKRHLALAADRHLVAARPSMNGPYSPSRFAKRIGMYPQE